MPKQYDVFSIRKEINRLVIFYIFPTAWYAIVRGMEMDSENVLLAFISGQLIVPITMILTAIMTLYPYYENKKVKRIKSVMTQIKENSQSKSNSKKISYSDNSLWILYVNRCNDDAHWNRFMHHLIREIAVENLCFILEVIQFKQQLIKKYYPHFNQMEEDQINDENIGFMMKLPENLPNCSIIFNNENKPKKQIYELYKKYISQDASLCVNVSYISRAQFINDTDCIFAIHEDSDSDTDDTQDTHSEHSELEQKTDVIDDEDNENGDDHQIINIQDKDLLKIFDNLLIDVSNNLDGAFFRFQSAEKMDNDNAIVLDMQKIASQLQNNKK